MRNTLAGIAQDGEMLAAYRQSVSSAIFVVVAFVLATLGALALARDVRGCATHLAQRVAAQSRRAPYKYLMAQRLREGSADPARLRRTFTVLAWVTFVITCGVLVLESLLVAVNGVR